MKVSIIVPVYNVSAYIENCLVSIMNQTYNNIECIIVDDASTDDSTEKCERMIADYKGSIRFEIIHHPINRGVSASRNTGIDAATGEYVFFIDSDDEISPTCIETLISPVFRDRSIEIVQGCFVKIRYKANLNKSFGYNQRLKKRNNQIFNTNMEIRDYFFSGKGYLNIGVWNKLMKKEFLVTHDLKFEEGLLWEDNLWFYFVMKHLSHLYLLPDITYCYYVRPQSITTGTPKRRKRHIWGQIFKTIIDNPTTNGDVQEQLYYLPKFCYYYVTEYKDEKYKYSYKAFEKTLTRPEANVPRSSLLLLKLAKYFAITPPTRYLFVLIYYFLSKFN